MFNLKNNTAEQTRDTHSSAPHRRGEQNRPQDRCAKSGSLQDISIDIKAIFQLRIHINTVILEVGNIHNTSLLTIKTSVGICLHDTFQTAFIRYIRGACATASNETARCTTDVVKLK